MLMPQQLAIFLRKIFREGGYIPQSYFSEFEKRYVEMDELQTL
jgi:hypothetical protein